MPADEFSSNFCEFVSLCLKKNPAERWSAEELLDHPFITTKVGFACVEDGQTDRRTGMHLIDPFD